MARDVEALVLMMDANINKFQRKLDEAQGKFDKTANAIEKRQRDLDKRLATLGSKAADFARPVQIGATLALGAITALSYEAAKRAQAVDGAFTQIWKDMPQNAATAASAISSEFGRLETDIKDNFSQLGGVLAGLGVKGQQALTIVDQLERRSLDLAAFKDVDDARAFQAVISGITGETEPLKAFGIVVNETATKAELLRLGFKGNAQQAPEAAKAIARTNLILAKSADIHGQVAREADTLSEKEKRVKAEFIGAAEVFGKQFLPVATDVLAWASEALKKFNELPTGTQNAALGLLGLVAVGGPIFSVIKGLKDLIATAVAARAAMLALGGSSGAAAAGAAGGVAARSVAGGLVAGATRAAGPIGAALMVSGDTPQRRLEGQQRINTALAEEARLTTLIARLRSEGNETEAKRQEAYQGRVRSGRELRQGLADIAREPTPQERSDEAARQALAGLGNIQLSGDQLKPVAGGSSGGGSGAAKAAEADAKRLAERRETLTLERDIDLARASGDEASIKAAEERQRLAQLTATYAQAEYADAKGLALEHLALLNAAEQKAEEREKAEKQVDIILEGRAHQLEREADYQDQLNGQLLDRLDTEAQLASLRGDTRTAAAKERELWIEGRINELLALRKGELSNDQARALANGEAGALDDATTKGRFKDLVVEAGRDFGSLTERAGDAFKQKALEGLADGLFKIISSAFGGQGSAAIKSLLDFIPGFAAGTSSAPGGLAYVHKGEVLTNLSKGTSVIPGHAVRAMGAMASAQDAMRGFGAQSNAANNAPVVRIYMDEGGLFAPRVQQISGPVAVQTTATGVAYAQGQTQQAAKRRRQSFV